MTFVTYHPQSSPSKTTVSFPQRKAWVSAAIATTEAERIQGLHGHAFLGANDGMLFWFPKQATPIAMTMAKMLIPLDIIFIGEDLTIRHIVREVPAGRVPPVIGPPVPWVLEVPAGFARHYKLTRGDLAVIETDE
jgi:uncharacterized membrane protein (UPF0127 family)